jgi:hypothetical protein
MAKSIRTLIFCYDDHRGFSEDVKKRFCDESRYTVASSPTREEFLSHMVHEKEHNFCKVAILGIHDTNEQLEMVEDLTKAILKIDSQTGLILLGPPEKIDVIRKNFKFNIDAFIPKNANSILRIHNTVKKLISEHSLRIFRKRSNFSIFFLLGFFIISVLLLILAYFRLPQYF